MFPPPLTINNGNERMTRTVDRSADATRLPTVIATMFYRKMQLAFDIISAIIAALLQQNPR